VIPVKKTNILTIGIVLIGLLLVAGCSQPQTTPPQQTPATTTVPPATVQATPPAAPAPTGDTVRLGTTTLGKVLTDANGMTLYFFVTDLAGEGVSTCYGGCASFWPIFSASQVTISPPLLPSEFSSFTRTDGTTQSTFRGWPLYYFKNDKKPGDVNGENVALTWYVARPDYTMMIASRPATGSYLTDGTGRALYVWEKDTVPDVSSCTGTCIQTWPAFWTDDLIAPSVLSPANFRTIIRGDGTKQWSYLGKPLYYYSVDRDAGDLYGQGIGNVWFAANVTGLLPVTTTPSPTATAAATTTVPTTTPPVYGGGGGY
jgi:predicted lipoprotein with Yx(FWY)xxD motif